MGTSCCVTAESWYRSGAVQRILKAAHEGHPRVSRTKARLRSSVYWPSLTKDVDQELKPCLACQATTEGKHHQDLLHPSQPPQKPWSKLGGDHWGPIPGGSGRHILVPQDYFTKYPEAIVTAAEANIRALEEVFGRHEYPKSLSQTTAHHGTGRNPMRSRSI